MIVTYGDFIGTLEVEIQKLRDAEDFLNDQGKLRLKAYRRIRDLTAFAESCQELIEIGVMQELEPEEKKSAHLALRAIDRIAEAERKELAAGIRVADVINAKDPAAEDAQGDATKNEAIRQQFNAMCNQRCRFLELGLDEQGKKCEECPLNKLAELIGM